MQYFFILGNNPALSVAELSAVFGLDNSAGVIHELPLQSVFILDIDRDIDTQKLIRRLGGTIKIGKVVSAAAKTDFASLVREAEKIPQPHFLLWRR